MPDPSAPGVVPSQSQDVKSEQGTPPPIVIGDIEPHGQSSVQTIDSDRMEPSTVMSDTVCGTTGPGSLDLGKEKSEESATLLQNPEFRYIRGDNSIGNLEIGMVEGLRLLQPLKDLLGKYFHSDTENRWLKEIETLKQKSETTRVVVGVVGTTGAGKSSLINALLDEERLVPTSGMRACTAVVTEISFNQGPDRYRAEIDFISPAEWEAELKLMFQDIESEDGSDGNDSEVAVARAKMEAVYPEIQNIRSSSVEELMKHNNVSNLLGRIVEFSEDNSTKFLSKLRTYVDSKPRGRRKTTEGNGSCAQDILRTPAALPCGLSNTKMEYWPLIRVVRLYVKAPVLANGAVIVDLPGLQDSNAARAAIAGRYIEQCSSIWIVSPITRAVDDKTAKTLLGDAFKRQIQMDGTFNRVTFICSKIDDFNSTEMQEALGLDQIMEQPQTDSHAPYDEIKKLEEKIQALKDERTQIFEALDELSDEIEEVETLQTPSKYSISPGKRQRVSDGLWSPRTNGSFEQSFGNTPDEQLRIDDDSIGLVELRDQLPADTAEQKLLDVSNKRKQLANRKRQIGLELRDFNQRLKIAQAKRQDMYRSCILGRNQVSKSQIQQDFADGIRQLDQADAEALDPENFDPSVCKRDYDAIANSLPVFCVSSRGYQKLQGRFQKEPSIKAFGNINDTEIPQLQAHCHGLIAAQHKATCQKFLNSLDQLLNSLALLSSTGSEASVCEEEGNKSRVFLDEKLLKLQNDLKGNSKQVFDEMMKTVRDGVFHKFGMTPLVYLMKRGYNSFENHVNRMKGWLHFGLARRQIIHSQGTTVRATKRDLPGTAIEHCAGAAGFTVVMAKPMLKVLGRDWERCFSQAVPTWLHAFAEKSSAHVAAFHNDVEDFVSKQSGATAWPRQLNPHLDTYSQSFDELSASCVSLLNRSQKSGSRAFVPAIVDAMKKGYDECASATGKGILLHMKGVMARHVEEARHQMFNKSAETVKTEVEKNFTAIQHLIAKETDNILHRISWDYRTALDQTRSAEQTALGEELTMFFQKLAPFKPSVSAS
ncbi:hypothetical protein GX51_00150 [Blastomyces parvus]|uniref:Dynamin N-terminal domain-containing protein n=1 Tax=Blastomyces parvus TaxID=2060905 RepID=A0A2B7XP28_9EURO|nr:hypothetical protein GX51_00150 [Blastomyces parvus]